MVGICSAFFVIMKVPKKQKHERKVLIMAKNGNGSVSPYAGNSSTPVKATHIKKGNVPNVKVIKPKG